jgi:uncharacterized protein DUF6594
MAFSSYPQVGPIKPPVKLFYMPDTTGDIETQTTEVGAADDIPKEYRPSYPTFAKKMRQFPQYSIVRGFRELAARGLLYRQAELKILERQLYELENSLYAGNWEMLSVALGPMVGSGRGSKRYAGCSRNTVGRSA